MGILNKIDLVICSYLGLSGHEVDRPRTISIVNNNLFITKNLPFQRHKSYETLKCFSEGGIQGMDKKMREKIGIAAGKSIAKDLTISFDKIEIKND